jgi:hypothetical protein
MSNSREMVEIHSNGEFDSGHDCDFSHLICTERRRGGKKSPKLISNLTENKSNLFRQLELDSACMIGEANEARPRFEFYELRLPRSRRGVFFPVVVEWN